MTKIKYIRLLSYKNACKVIEFINKDIPNDYASIVSGGVKLEISDENWGSVLNLLIALKIPFEVSEIPPHITNQEIIETFKPND
jgi:hypothetical protein